MPFERGSFSCRFFTMPRALPEDALEHFARNAAPPLEHNSLNEIKGWVTGRHLLDRLITPETAYFAGYLRLQLMIAEKKIPRPLLQAECRMAELAQLAAEGKAFLNRKERKEIQEQIVQRLLPQMPHQLKAIPLVVDERSNILYTGALSDSQVETLMIYWRHTLGYEIYPMTPALVAKVFEQTDAETWRPTSFSEDVPDEFGDACPGRDFLTWLWFVSETQGGKLDIPGHGEIAFMLEGPLTFIFEGNGAHETVLRKGNPLLSAEAKTCLIGGKKLKSARITIAHGDLQWQAGLNADEFTFGSLKLPEDDATDDITRFQERMNFLAGFREIFFHLYHQFCEDRKHPPKWTPVQKAIQEWVKTRQGKK